MKIWILASVASFVLLGENAWGADEQPGKGKPVENVTEESFNTMLTDAGITTESTVTKIRSQHTSLVAKAEAKGREAGIEDYCPNLQKAKDNDFIKIILTHAQKAKAKILAKSETLNYKGKKDIKHEAKNKTAIDPTTIDQPGVKYFSGLRRRYNGVFRLLPNAQLSPWEGLVISTGANSLQLEIDSNDATYWDQYKTTDTQNSHTGKVYLYDTFNIAGINLSQFMDKISFSSKDETDDSTAQTKAKPKAKKPSGKKTWRDLPLRKRQTKLLICNMSMKTNCYNLEGWKKNIKGCPFTKVEICLRQAQELKSTWLTKMLEQYFDYAMSRIKETGRVKTLSGTEKITLFAQFYSYTFPRFAANGENIDTTNPLYARAKADFVNNPTIRQNAVYALVLDEASKRHIDQTGKLEDKKFLKEQLELLLQDAGKIIAQIQYKRQEVNSSLGNLIGSGGMDRISHEILRKIIKDEVTKLHNADKEKATGKGDTGNAESTTKPTKKEEEEEKQ